MQTNNPPRGLPLRFNSVQLLVGVALTCICVAVIVRMAREKRRNAIVDVYGSREAYDILCLSPNFTAFKVVQNTTPEGAGILPNFANDLRTSSCDVVPPQAAAEVRELLTETEAFRFDFTKDFIFQPTIALRAEDGKRQVDLYLDFGSKTAALMLNGDLVGRLYTDRISQRLRELITSACETRGSAPASARQP